MTSLLTKLVNRDPVTDADIAEELYDICADVHASCDSGCPVFEKNFGVVNAHSKNGCSCFKNGKAMLEFLRN